MNLPLYKLVIDDENAGVDFIALVDNPAIEINWLAFDKSKEIKFVAKEDRKIISGPLMLAETPIYRRDAGGEYNVVFDAQTIEKIAQRYFKNQFTSNINEMHDPKKKVEGVHMFESFIIDESRGIRTPEGFDKLPEGSWFGSFKVDNQEVWDDFIKTGIFKGFSVEGVFNYEPIEMHDHVAIDAIIEALK